MEASVALRDARRSAQLTLRELGHASGVSPARISDYERGRHEPSAGMLDRLLSAAGYHLVAVERSPVDVRRNAATFADVLTLVDALPPPRRRRPDPPTWAEITRRADSPSPS